MKKLLLSIILLANAFAVFAQIPAANHNLGCSASTGDGSAAVEGVSRIRTIIPGGDQQVTVNQQQWGGTTAEGTSADAKGHNTYKFTATQDYGTGGFQFDVLDESRYNTYLHVAIYVTQDTKVQIRLTTPGGGEVRDESGNVTYTYNKYQVNTTELQLTSGWNYENLPLDIYAEDRINNPRTIPGFAYWDCGNTFNFDVSNIQQVGFVITENGHSIWVDDMYFYELPYTTTDDDGENIDWNTTTGTTCQVKRVFQTTDEPTE